MAATGAPMRTLQERMDPMVAIEVGNLSGSHDFRAPEPTEYTKGARPSRIFTGGEGRTDP
jgi:hypothetical protein